MNTIKPLEYVKQMIDDGREIVGILEIREELIEIVITPEKMDDGLEFIEVSSPQLNDYCQVEYERVMDCESKDCVEEMIWRAVVSQYKTEQGLSEQGL